MNSEPNRTNDPAAKEWRELGFYSELNDKNKSWTLSGTRAGLLRFRDLLLAYVADPRNAKDSEHEHYGPYGTLEIMTWAEAGLDGHAIHGSLKDLTRLASLVEQKLSLAHAGSVIRMREEFAPQSPYALLLDVREDQFDPASLDPDLSDRAT